MENVRAWVLTLCACAALISAAETLLPEGAVRKTSYLVLSLIAASCLAAPLKALPELSLPEGAELSGGSFEPSAQDWLLAPTEEQFAANVESLVRQRLLEEGVRAAQVSAFVRVTEDGAELGNIRVTVEKCDSERLDEIESLIAREFGTTADVTVRG